MDRVLWKGRGGEGSSGGTRVSIKVKSPRPDNTGLFSTDYFVPSRSLRCTPVSGGFERP